MGSQATPSNNMPLPDQGPDSALHRAQADRQLADPFSFCGESVTGLHNPGINGLKHGTV